MTSQPATSGRSTAGHIAGVLAVVLVIVSWGAGSSIALLGSLICGLVGLVLGIMARRESAITLSVVALLGFLAVGFGLV